MKIKNTRRVNERIIQLFSRVQLNNAIGMALAMILSILVGTFFTRIFDFYIACSSCL